MANSPLKDSYNLFIDGVATPSAAGAYFDVKNPATDSVVCRVAEGREEDVNRAIDVAKQAFEDGRWSKLSPRVRGRVLIKAADLLRGRIDEIAVMETLQTGRAIKEMRVQLSRIPEWFEYFGGIIQGLEGSVPPFSDERHVNYVKRLPLGVCGLITPWNHPLLIASKKIAPALATGNTLVVKPSELAPAAVILLAEILTEAGLPRGVINVVPGYGATAGRALCAHPVVRKLDLTGGTETGRLVAAAAGRNLIPCCAELGGNAPVLIFQDCNLEQAVNGAAFGAFVASGQTCVSAKRILVEEPIYEEFLQKFTAKAAAIRLGDPMDPNTQMGPVISAGQRANILKMIQTAPQQGATIHLGGTAESGLPGALGQGYFILPTIITGASMDATCFQEEIFGPVVTVTPFKDEAHALQLANGVKFALGGGIWTQNVSRAHRVAAALEAGVIWINAHHRNDPSSPWGGFKDSGMGRENGWEALYEYTAVKSVVVPLDDGPFDWFGESKRYG